MGQKVNPHGIRLTINKDWSSKWYANKRDYARFLADDHKIRTYVEKKLKHASVSRVGIERLAGNVKVIIHTARPGLIIGRKGSDIDILRKDIFKLIGIPVSVTIQEIKKPDLEAQLLANSVAQQLEKRMMFRRVMKRSIQSCMRQGAKGVKVCLSGRLGGAEIARTEWSKEGRVPLHTFRADIDYATARATTTYGIIGVKIWIFKGEVIRKKAPIQVINTADAVTIEE